MCLDCLGVDITADLLDGCHSEYHGACGSSLFYCNAGPLSLTQGRPAESSECHIYLSLVQQLSCDSLEAALQISYTCMHCLHPCKLHGVLLQPRLHRLDAYRLARVRVPTFVFCWCASLY